MPISKPDLTRVWASGAPGANVVDPDTTTPGKFAAGWQAEVPPFEHFNFLQQLFTQGLVYNNEQGINQWDADTTYPVGGLVKGSDNIVYEVLVEQSGNNPVLDTSFNYKQSPINYLYVFNENIDFNVTLQEIISEDISNNLVLKDKTYNVSDSITATDYPIKLIGSGFFQEPDFDVVGTVLDNVSGDANTVLTIQGGAPRQGRGAILEDFSIKHGGDAAAIVIDNTYSARLKGVAIFGENTGPIGIETIGSTFLTHLEDCFVQSFTSIGILLDSVDGTMDRIIQCNVASGFATAVAGIEVREGARRTYIEGGQINLSRGDDLGVGIRFNNTGASLATAGGVVRGVLCEHGIAVEITGDTDNWRDVHLYELEVSGSLAKAVVFDRAIECYLTDPVVSSSGTILAEFTANSQKCGVYCNLIAARSSYIVDPAATGCFIYVKGRMLYSDRALVTTDPNLTVTCEDVEGLGTTQHNGSYWDKYLETMPDDSSVNYSALGLPTEGVVEVFRKDGAAYLKAAWHSGGMTEIGTGLNSTVDTTPGNLNGTTGADGDLTVRYNSGTSVLYVENRLGAQDDFVVVLSQ